MMVGLRTTARFLLFLKPFSFWLNWLHPEIRTCPRQEEEMQALILPPENPNDRAEWHEELHQWRSVTRSLMRYSSASYDDPAYIWMQRCFALGFVMMFDTRFYDPVTGKFTIKTVLDQAEHDSAVTTPSCYGTPILKSGLTTVISTTFTAMFRAA
jgi:hypothetical protein